MQILVDSFDYLNRSFVARYWKVTRIGSWNLIFSILLRSLLFTFAIAALYRFAPIVNTREDPTPIARKSTSLFR